MLANVRLADFSGSCADILVDGEAWRGLAGVESMQDLYDQINREGVQSLTYRRKCDIRIGANRRPKVQLPGAQCATHLARVMEFHRAPSGRKDIVHRQR